MVDQASWSPRLYSACVGEPGDEIWNLSSGTIKVSASYQPVQTEPHAHDQDRSFTKVYPSNSSLSWGSSRTSSNLLAVTYRSRDSWGMGEDATEEPDEHVEWPREKKDVAGEDTPIEDDDERVTGPGLSEEDTVVCSMFSSTSSR